MELLFLDTETTGKDDDARLVQLAYAKNNDIPTCQNYKPPVEISVEAMSVHGITNEHIAECLPFSVNRPFVQGAIDESILVAHNAAFDVKILENEGLKVDHSRVIDTLKVAQHLYDLPQYKLQYLRYYFKLDVAGDAHSADGDVEVLRALFNLLKEKISVEEMLTISQHPVLMRRLPFGKYKKQTFEEVTVKDIGYLEWLSKQADLSEDLKYTLEYWKCPF
ncbi:MAG: exonuclease domain-containing protein [Candidatus Komeilibacteria bacterium]|nr:exonuclease domain-containing protein [Candidatus Komeilibacteria bacterium]